MGDVYQRRDPPQRAANTPLLSLDQLRVVEGFDTPLAEALRPYVTVAKKEVVKPRHIQIRGTITKVRTSIITLSGNPTRR